MSLYSTLKQNAKLALKGNWGKTIGILVIVYLAMMVLMIPQQLAISLFILQPNASNPTMEQIPISVSPVEIGLVAVFMLVVVLVSAPLQLGLCRWFYGVVHGKQMGIGEAFGFFEGFRRFRRAAWYFINLLVRSYLWAILFFAVPGAVLGISMYFINVQAARAANPRAMALMGTMGMILAFLLMILAFFLYFAYMNKYALAAYLLCEDDETGVSAAIKTSCRYTKGYRFSLMWFSFSFIGWALLCVFVFPLLYVVPYVNTSVFMYFRYIVEKNRAEAPAPTQEFRVEEELPPVGEG